MLVRTTANAWDNQSTIQSVIRRKVRPLLRFIEKEDIDDAFDIVIICENVDVIF